MCSPCYCIGTHTCDSESQDQEVAAIIRETKIRKT